jgi:hypothetical protein
MEIPEKITKKKKTEIKSTKQFLDLIESIPEDFLKRAVSCFIQLKLNKYIVEKWSKLERVPNTLPSRSKKISLTKKPLKNIDFLKLTKEVFSTKR